MSYVIALSVIAGALSLYYILFKNLDYFKKCNILHLKPLPLVGNLGPLILRKQFVGDLVKQLYDMYPEAKYIGMYDMTKPIIMLRDIDLIKTITNKYFDIFPDHYILNISDQDPIFSKNLFALRGDRWREVRTMLSPSFTSYKMKNMFKLMSECGINFANFVAKLPPEQRVIQTKDYFTRYTNDVIATCAFGVSIDSMRDPKNLFYVYGKESVIFEGTAVFKFYIFRSLPWLAQILKLRYVNKKIAKFFRDLVETTIRTRDEKGIVRPDMLQLMMESRDKKEDRKNLTIEDMTSQAFSFFFAGFESTSTMMCFAAHEIAVNEDVRKRLQNEIDQVLKNTNGQVTYEAINSMKYLEAVISETLRMYPNAVVFDRVCTKDFELPPALPSMKPYILKKGEVLIIPAFGLHYDSKYFKEPEKFDPDRFVGEQKKLTSNTGAYLPFGLGPRICIGKRFALLETKVLLFHLLARCDLLPCEKTPLPLKFAKDSLIMKPVGGFWIKTVSRKDPHRIIEVNKADNAL